MKKKNMYITLMALALLSLCVLEGSAGYRLFMHGVSIETDIEFAQPKNVGLDALLALYPKTAAPGREDFSVMAVMFSADQKKDMEREDINLMDYTRTVFLGVVPRGAPVTRTFSGESRAGERFTKKIPRPITGEIYVVALKNGSSVALAFQWTAAVKDDAAEKVIAAAAASFREDVR